MRIRAMNRVRFSSIAVSLVAAAACGCGWISKGSGQQTYYATPEDAASALIETARKGTTEDLLKIFGPDAQPLVDTSDPKAQQLRRQVFVVAAREEWRLVEDGADKRTLEIGNEHWPFPVPLVKDGGRWKFDTKTGVEEVVARRIGRNELAAIRACRTYVVAQLLYAQQGHDGKPAGLYATVLRSDPGKQNGLYWAAARGEKRSPLGDLLADAAEEGKSPFHGYRFKILKPAQSTGFALVAWPAEYDSTGVMTFMVSDEGIVREKDLGSDTSRVVAAMDSYAPDGTWDAVR